MCAFDLPDGETRGKFRNIAYEKGMLIFLRADLHSFPLVLDADARTM